MRQPNRLRVPGLLLLLGLAACARCGGCGPKPAGPVTRSALALVPATADGVIWVPELGTLGERLAELQQLELLDFVAPLLRARDGDALVEGIVRQVGVDLRSRESLAKAGLDPAGDVALALHGNGQGAFVLSVKDAKAFEQTLTQLAARLLGAGEVTRETVEGREVIRFASAGGAPRLAYTRVGRHALLVTGTQLPQLTAWAKLEPAQSMQSQPVFEASRARLAGAPVAWVFGRGGGRFIHQGTVSGATLALHLEKKALTVRADVPWPERAAMLGSLVATKDAPVLLGRLPPNAFAVLRYTGDAAALGDFWTWLVGGRVTRAMQQVGVDVKQEILGNLKPGLVASLSLAPTARMTGLPALDVRRTNPFSFAHFTLVADTRDPARTAGLLEKLPELTPRLGARTTSAERAGQKVWLTQYAAGEGAHAAQVGSFVTLASPEPSLVASIARLQGKAGTSPVAAEFQPVLEKHALAVVVDLHALAAEVRALPEEAWGIGGFALKPTTVRWLDALKELRAVTATLDARDQALQAEVTLRLKVEGT